MGWPDEIKKDIVAEEHFNRVLKTYVNRPGNLNDLLANSVAVVPEKKALVCDKNKLTYAQFQKKVNDMANQLALKWKIKRGDRVAVLFDNGIEFCLTVFALSSLGAIAVTLNTRLRAAELEFMLNDSHSILLLMSKKNWRNINEIQNNLITIKQIFVQGGAPIPEGTLPFELLLQETVSQHPPVHVSEEDVVFIVYTSGTTGKPKGAMVTHFNIIHSCMNYQKVMSLTENDSTLVAVPLFHITGMVAQLFSFVYVGGTVIIMKEFKTLQFIEKLSFHKATHTIVVPTIYVLMLMNENLDQYDFNFWRIAAYGGAPISKETVSKLSTRFPNLQLYNCYGATETTSPATISPSHACRIKPFSVGLPLPVSEIHVCNEMGEKLEAQEVGELWIKGPMVVPGYWNNPEANDKEFTGGFWHSGDMGKIDEDGLVYVLDRKKDMINRGGEKIFCVEVEDVLYSHPKVMEVAVVGIPDAIFGEQVKAVIVPKPGEIITFEEIKEYVGNKLAHFKVPQSVAFVSNLPRNAGGKVIKRELIDNDI